MSSFPKRQLFSGDVLASKVFTANAQIEVFDVSDFNSVTLQVAVAGTLNLVPEISLDGSVWTAAISFLLNTGAQTGTLVNAAVGTAYRVNVAGVRFFRLRCSSYTSTATVLVFRSAIPGEGVDAASPLPVGANLVGDVGLGIRSVTGGLNLVSRLASAAASTNGTVVKASAGRVYKIRGFNASAATKFLKLYNKTTAPTVGTDVPVATIALKAGEPYDVSFESIGLYFATGIGFAITGAAADNDTTVLAAADIVGQNIWYV